MESVSFRYKLFELQQKTATIVKHKASLGAVSSTFLSSRDGW